MSHQVPKVPLDCARIQDANGNPMQTTRPPLHSRGHLIATDHYRTTMASLRILEPWGHAANAGMAAVLYLNVLFRNQRTSAVLHPP